MSIKFERREMRSCDCGCGQEFPMFTGLMIYEADREVAFRAAHLRHGNSGPHFWLLLGSGPWFEDDGRGCWVAIHAWISEGKLITRIEDPECSPFSKADAFEERLLTRSEVLAREGAKEWAIDRREQFVLEHQATSDFILGSEEAQPAIAADRADDPRAG